MTSHLHAPRSPERSSQRGAGWVRSCAVVLLIVVGAVLTPITIVALFANTEISDTSRYVQNVSPLASNASIQAFVADRISSRLLAHLDEHRYIASLLPERAQPLVAPMRNAFDSFVHSTTLRVVESDQFQRAWDSANRAAHSQINNVLTGAHSKVLVESNGHVSIDMSAVVQKVTQALHNSGVPVFDHIPIVVIGRQIPIFESKDLYKARKAVGLLDRLAFILPFLVFGCFGLAIWLARNHRRAFLWSAIGFALGALVLSAALALMRNRYLDATSSKDIPRDAAAAMYDTLVRFLHTSVRTALLCSTIVIVTVFFAGPSRFARSFRSRARRSAEWLGTQSDEAGWRWLGPVGAVVRHKGAWRIVVAAALFVVLFRWRHPTPAVVAWFALAALGLLALIEYFGREADAVPVRRERAATSSAAD